MTPEFARSLIRLANRDRFNATEVAALVEFSEYMVAITGEKQDPAGASALIGMWKESFDEP